MIMKKSTGGGWNEIGRTETVVDNNNPDFVRQFIVDFNFEEVQTYRADLYDRDSSSERLNDHDFIGSSGEFSLGKLMVST